MHLGLCQLSSWNKQWASSPTGICTQTNSLEESYAIFYTIEPSCGCFLGASSPQAPSPYARVGHIIGKSCKAQPYLSHDKFLYHYNLDKLASAAAAAASQALHIYHSAADLAYEHHHILFQGAHEGFIWISSFRKILNHPRKICVNNLSFGHFLLHAKCFWYSGLLTRVSYILFRRTS